MDDWAVSSLPARVREALGVVRSRLVSEPDTADGWDNRRIERAVADFLGHVRDLGRDPTPSEACRMALADQAALRGCPMTDPSLAAFGKAVKLGYAMAMCTLEDVPDHEASMVRACADHEPAAAPGPEVAATGPVRFAYVSMEAVRGRRNPRPVARQGHVGLVPVPGCDAPVVARLLVEPAAGRAGGEVALRRHGDAWLRPVLAPGGWEPLDETGFRHACASGASWVDDPFATRAGTGPRLGVADVAAPPGTGAPQGHPAKVAAQAGDAMQACLRRAGTLFIVDGVVHRTTGAPGLHVEVTGTDRWQARIRTPFVHAAWHLDGDISSSTDQATHGRQVVQGVDDLLVGLASREGRVVSLPLDAGDLASLVVTRLAGDAGAGRAFAAAEADTVPCVEILDADAFPASRDVARGILLALDGRLPFGILPHRREDGSGPFAWAESGEPIHDGVSSVVHDPDPGAGAGFFHGIPDETMDPGHISVTGTARALVGALVAMARREEVLAAEAVHGHGEEMAAFRP